MSGLLTERLIQRQINHWNRLREFLPARDASRPVARGPVITVSRQAGAGGRTLAENLAERLGLALHDRSLVEQVVRREKLAPAMVARLDEQALSEADLWVQGVLRQRIFMREQYRQALTEVVEEVARGGHVVFLGRGANMVLGMRADLRIRLVAGPGRRADRLGRRLGLTAADACALRDDTDARRDEFVRRLFGCDPADPTAFDLVLNTDRLDADAVVENVMLGLLAVVAGERTRVETA
ncbi:cytidylate kinase-like family protein [bacterium]|nr:cytidylate kinase-like family protein [bacterium]